MNFRDLLRELSEVGRTTSKDLAHRLSRSVKEISNDLRRLKTMGLVKGERQKRLCKSRWLIRGNFYRGFEYIYFLSKQDKSYLKWMNEDKPIEDQAYRRNLNVIAANLPSDLKKQIFEHYFFRKARKYKGTSRRYDFLADLAFTNSAILGEPSPLELENRRLREENKRLAMESERNMRA